MLSSTPQPPGQGLRLTRCFPEPACSQHLPFCHLIGRVSFCLQSDFVSVPVSGHHSRTPQSTLTNFRNCEFQAKLIRALLLSSPKALPRSFHLPPIIGFLCLSSFDSLDTLFHTQPRENHFLPLQRGSPSSSALCKCLLRRWEPRGLASLSLGN